MTISFELNGSPVSTSADSQTLLEVMRGELGVLSVKDGCSPQGQCGCCTVLIDGVPRISCVTPVRRIAGRSVTTVEGLDEIDRAAWAGALCATGGSQCGFCTPGIILRLQGLRSKSAAVGSESSAIDRVLAAHLCRCTGWQTIREAAVAVCATRDGSIPQSRATARDDRDLAAAGRRASIEGRVPQRVDPAVALGRGGFADDSAPVDALVAVPDGDGGWVVADTLAAARAAAGKVQGRRSTVESHPPLDVPPGEWDLTLQTSWVEPAYLETDASWCEPGGQPSDPLANGGAFGAKASSVVRSAARELADRHGRCVRVLLSREDCVRLGPKRPPIAAGIRVDGSGTLRVVRTSGIADLVHLAAPGLAVEEVVPRPPDGRWPTTSSALRASGWAEAAILLAAVGRLGSGGSGTPISITAPNGAVACVTIGRDGRLLVSVACGDPIDETVLRSYSIGAAHMALGWVTSESLAVDDSGVIHDLTIRSFGIRRAADMPEVEVDIVSGAPPGLATDDPINGSDAVFAAVAAAVWIHQGHPPRWPTRLPFP